MPYNKFQNNQKILYKATDGQWREGLFIRTLVNSQNQTKCHEIYGQGNVRLTVHLDRVRAMPKPMQEGVEYKMSVFDEASTAFEMLSSSIGMTQEQMGEFINAFKDMREPMIIGENGFDIEEIKRVFGVAYVEKLFQFDEPKKLADRFGPPPPKQLKSPDKIWRTISSGPFLMCPRCFSAIPAQGLMENGKSPQINHMEYHKTVACDWYEDEEEDA
jgi:hypothetical protein